MSVQSLQQQILAQGTTGKWSGEGYGSAEANAADMARILDSIGITNINQFGQFDKTTTTSQQVYPEMTATYYGDADGYGAATPTGRYYTSDYEGNRTYIDPQYVAQGTRTVEGSEGPEQQNYYVANIPTTQTVYGNKATGQAVPTTYSERQTGNAWGGTFAGSGNTGYRVQFDANGNPYFYTTGASSNDLANLLGDNSILNFAANLGAFALGGPGGVAALQAAQGKDIGDIAKAAALSYAGGQLAGAVSPEISSALGGGTTGNVAANAITSGTLSEIQGGDFLQGALQGAVSGGINEAKQSLMQEQFDTGMTESGLAGQTAIDDSTFGVVDAPYQIDSSFTPDYSLSSVASGAPSLALKPLDTTYNVGSFDYSLGNLIDSLGLKMPETPNVDSMGGGQGIILKTTDGYITDQGFVPDSYVSSLGDPESFINKPVIDVGLSLNDVKGSTQEDISGKLAGLDLAKALSPYALAALAKGVYNLASDEDATSGFAMVPVPSHWKSPEYNQAFTPSAPIDFGSNELLKGTQWETPSLSNVINTLNYQPVAYGQQSFAQPQQQFQVPDILQQFQSPSTVGMNDVVGNLDGKQVSISDIISGIQSQYG